MMMRVLTFALGLVLVSSMREVVAAEPVDFAHQVAPILKKHCGRCHLGEERKGGLSLNTRALVLEGGESGPVAVAGQSAMSELLTRIATEDPEIRMPPDRPPLSAAEVEAITKWIDAELPWEPGFSFAQSGYEPPLKPRRPELPPATDGRMHPVDRIVDAYLAEHDIPRPGPIDDAAFLRRASLDLAGLLPTLEQLNQFTADSAPGKREALVQELLADDVAYAEHWLTFWNDLLRNDYTGTGFITGGRKQITGWLYGALLDNQPYDRMVRELIVASPESEGFIAGIRWRGNVNASQTLEVQFSQNISQAFLGINMKCASCHDSFVDNWKLRDAYGLAAIYATEPLAMHRCDKPTGETAEAAWIFPELGRIDPQATQPERMKQLASLLTHPDNGRLSRTIVNRLWHRLLGRGVVYPVDAMHTPPWSADLLDFLAIDFAQHGYDLKHTLALIATSQTYQSRTPIVEEEATGESGYVFRGPLPRRLTAEQFLDAVWQITGDAPATPDAQVLRGKPAAGVVVQPPTGQWIWSTPAGAGSAPAGETIAFRRTLTLTRPALRAVAAITCDNEYTLYINGRKVRADANWETVETVPLEPALKTGDNAVLIVAKNAGSAPNPAALLCEIRMRFNEGPPLTVATDEQWEWTATVPDGRGRFKQEPRDWQPAAVVPNPAVWVSRVGGQIATALSFVETEPRMVRASLMKADELMRALGRPNRDQIVTMRPTELTTLEAIDLANGERLASALAGGASRRLAEHGESEAALVHWLFRFALSRLPTAEELAVSHEILGEQPTPERVQDLLWSVLMLPEFQFVR